VAARMAMLDPRTVRGIIPLGTSMDSESQRSRDLGCWDGIAFCTPAIDALAASVGDDWLIPTELVDAVLHEGLGEDVPPDERTFLARGTPGELRRRCRTGAASHQQHQPA
jgi:hypothetical protein